MAQKLSTPKRQAKRKANITKVVIVLLVTAGLLGATVWWADSTGQIDIKHPSDYDNFLNVGGQTYTQAKEAPKAAAAAESNELVFLNPTSTQENYLVVANAELSKPSSGICKFQFEQSASIIQTTTTVSNALACESRVALSRFPQGGMWFVSIQYVNRDGQVLASQVPFQVYIAK